MYTPEEHVKHEANKIAAAVIAKDHLVNARLWNHQARHEHKETVILIAEGGEWVWIRRYVN